MNKKKKYIEHPDFSLLVHKWQALTDEEKEEWHRKSKGKEYSGYNYFIKTHMKKGVCIEVYETKDEEYIRILGEKARKATLFRLGLLIFTVTLYVLMLWNLN